MVAFLQKDPAACVRHPDSHREQLFLRSTSRYSFHMLTHLLSGFCRAQPFVRSRNAFIAAEHCPVATPRRSKRNSRPGCRSSLILQSLPVEAHCRPMWLCPQKLHDMRLDW